MLGITGRTTGIGEWSESELALFPLSRRERETAVPNAINPSSSAMLGHLPAMNANIDLLFTTKDGLMFNGLSSRFSTLERLIFTAEWSNSCHNLPTGHHERLINIVDVL